VVEQIGILFKNPHRCRIFSMSNFIPKAAEVKVRGLGPKAQKLQALREKAAQANNSENPVAGASTASVKVKDSFAGTKKTNFQRKAT
jgi:hypothetical protein